MSCCGGQRQGTVRAAPDDRSMSSAPAPIEFVYTGATALTVIGGGTGRCYRFGFPDCRLEVHARDAPGFGSIPMLRRAA